MREILFRGKRADNGEWIEGYLNQHRGRVIFDCCCNAINSYDYYINDYAEKFDTDLYGCVYKVIPETVGQYTGLNDRNGVRIFEGDIVSLAKHNGLIYKVVYEPCRFELVNSKDINCFVLDIYKSEDIEVIGNIHDPELLEGGGGE